MCDCTLYIHTAYRKMKPAVRAGAEGILGCSFRLALGSHRLYKTHYLLARHIVGERRTVVRNVYRLEP